MSYFTRCAQSADTSWKGRENGGDSGGPSDSEGMHASHRRTTEVNVVACAASARRHLRSPAALPGCLISSSSRRIPTMAPQTILFSSPSSNPCFRALTASDLSSSPFLTPLTLAPSNHAASALQAAAHTFQSFPSTLSFSISPKTSSHHPHPTTWLTAPRVSASCDAGPPHTPSTPPAAPPTHTPAAASGIPPTARSCAKGAAAVVAMCA